MSAIIDNTPSAIVWMQEELKLLDQRQLPQLVVYLQLDDVAAVADAIRQMVVRGAPAIGITAAYGVVIAARQRYAENRQTWQRDLEPDLELLAAARPTAVNLCWALQRMKTLVLTLEGDPFGALEAEAILIHQEDIAANQKMAGLGADLLVADSAVLTHCNAGALATGGVGTALGVIRAGFASGKIDQVFADETRPWLQGARLTAWELVQEQIPVTLLCEGAAARLMQQGKIGWVIVGSDRIAANGDVANKIGTLSLAVLARHFGVKMMVVAPSSTVDMQLASGDLIPIEQRGADELLELEGKRIAAEGAQAWTPAFDVTPAELVDVIVTERGVVWQPSLEKMKSLMG
ncbi:MAG: S-methyl-5-thioribose-1-phosphate isomerase [Gammaproteobacteria bacterium]|nr:S-methyl-5-thioribose-1-phosphate isomerase [Gammaproteobacteria bacterium]